jgi:hypothetical protein
LWIRIHENITHSWEENVTDRVTMSKI